MDKKNKNPEIRFKGFTEDWEEKLLADEVDFFTGLTYSPSNVVKTGGTLVLRSSNVKNSQIVLIDNVFVESEVVNCENVIVGDIIIVVRNGSRNLIGKHALIKENMPNTVIGAFMTGIHSKQPDFINSLLDTNQFEKEIEKNLGATINQITTGALKKMTFWFPKEDEQKQIGIFFQNLDNLITLHQKRYDKLVVLKKAMLVKMFPKKGALVPEIRFKGFTEDWEVKYLGDIGNTYTGLTGKTKIDFGHGRGQYVTYMNVFNNPISNTKLTELVEVDNSQNEVNFGDVFFTTSSETPEDVGMSSVWLSNEKNVYLNSFCFGYRLTEKIDSYFLSSLLRSTSFRKKISFLAQGISRYNISKNKVMDISIEIPSNKEQVKIGKYFQNLDNQIDLHKTQLDKLNNIKKGCFTKMFVAQD
jgi:type I restriction enzyme, S subunit